MTLTPVALVKASSSATNASSSACTKYFHRSMASWAFFSGFHGAVCAQAFAHPSSAGPVSAPAAAASVPPVTRVRRVRSVMMVSSVCLISPSPARGGGNLIVEPFAGCPVEQVNQSHVGLEAHAVTGLELIALAEPREHVLDVELGYDLGFRPGRLDHLDFGVDTVVRKSKVLGTHTINDRCGIGPVRHTPLRRGER